MPKENRKIAKTATEILRILWEEGVFKSWLKLANVVEKLSQKGYHFPLMNVNKALERAPYLTRRGKKGGYEHIQRYPYIKEKEIIEPTKKK